MRTANGVYPHASFDNRLHLPPPPKYSRLARSADALAAALVVAGLGLSVLLVLTFGGLLVWAIVVIVQDLARRLG